MATISRRRFIKTFIKSKLELARKRRADRRSQKQIAKQITKVAESRPMSNRLWRFLVVAPFVILLVLVAVNYLPTQPKPAVPIELAVSNLSSQAKLLTVTKVDEVVETEIVASVADQANLPVAIHAANTATSAEIQANSVQKAEPVLAKPEISSLEGGRQGIKLHVVQVGETIQQLAETNDVSVQTIKWANNLTGDGLNAGQEIKILPVDGVYYTVKAGDTYESLVKRYGSNQGQIVAINNLELVGLLPGSAIVIPDGVLPEKERPGYVAPKPKPTVQAKYYRPSDGSGVKYYPWGWCTWYAAYRFPQINGGKEIGRWGNANTWDNSAYGTPGFSVSSVPSAGAIFQTDFSRGSRYSLGHVGIVESVNYNDDGSISSVNVSDMNGIAGWGRVGHATWLPDKFNNYKYIK